jgi:putative MATE family efflux protein
MSSDKLNRPGSSDRPSPTGIRLKSLYSLFKLSLSAAQQDYTTGSIRRAVLLLSVPMILEMCMESLFGVVDLFFVGKLGKESLAAAGLTESLLTIVFCVAVGMSMAATAMVARRIGEKNPEEAAHAAAQAILMGAAVTIVLTFLGYSYAPRLLQIMGASPSVVAIGAPYTRVVFGGCLVIMLLFLINGIFRGAGNAATAMWALWIGNGCNIILCPVMIHFYGLPGAAYATVIGRAAGVAYQLYHLFNRKGVIRLLRKHFLPDWAIIRGIYSIAWTGTLQFLIGGASWIVMARIIAKNFGSEAIAGYQVAIRILIFFLLPAWGMGNAAATLVGQNLGAKQPLRAEQSVWTAARYNTLFMIGVSLLLLFWAGPIVGFINSDPGVDKVAVLALHIVSMGYVFYGVGMVLSNAFNGAGDSRTPTLLNLFCYWGFQMPIAYLMAVPWRMGPTGVFLAILFAEVLITITSFLVFRRGNWKKVKI